MKIMITKTKMLPCWANQNPSLKPPIWILSKASDQIIPNPKDTKNHTISNEITIFKFDFQ